MSKSQDKNVTFRTNQDIYKFLKDESGNKGSVKKLYEYIKKQCPKEPYNSSDSKQIMKFSEKVTNLLFDMLNDCGGDHDNFTKTHAKWLNTNVNWPVCESVDLTALFDPWTDSNTSHTRTTLGKPTTKNIKETKKIKQEAMTNKDVYILLKTKNNLDFRKLNRWFEETCPSELVNKHSKAITNFSVKYTQSLRKKLTDCQNDHSILLERHAKWLDDKFKWPSCLSEFATSITTKENDESIVDYKNFLVEMFEKNSDILKFLYNADSDTMNNYKQLYEHILEHIPMEDDKEELEDFTKNITTKCFRMFAECNFDIAAMEKQHQYWLNARVQWPECIQSQLPNNTISDTSFSDANPLKRNNTTILEAVSDASPPKLTKLDLKGVDDCSELELALALVCKLVKSDATASVIRDLVANPSLASEFQDFMRTKNLARKSIARPRRRP